MTTDTCRNCGATATETHDVLVRSDGPAEVPLCQDCHDAMGQEFIWASGD